MNKHPCNKRIGPVITAGLITLAVVLPLEAYAMRPSLTVTVLPDRYVVDGSTFRSLGALETHIQAIGPRRIVVRACGAAATFGWKAAVHRFRGEPLELQVLEPDHRDCSAPQFRATGMHQQVRHYAADVDGEAVDLYWRELMP